VKASATLVSILVVSVVVWSFFYFSGYPLDAGSTTVVVGLMAILVTLVAAGARRLAKPKKDGKSS
jgi:amino acid transporter